MAEIPVPTKVAVLDAVLRREPQEQICRANSITPDTFRLILSKHGYPSTSKMQWALDVMKGDLERGEVEGLHKTTQTALAAAVQSPEVTTCVHAQWIARGRASAVQRTQRLAEKASAALADLKAALATEEAEKEQAAAREAEARKALADAEKELKKAQAAAERAKAAKREAEKALKSTKPRAKTPATEGARDWSVIRAWAAETGIACPRTGRVPRTVLAAYDAAHSEEPAA